MRLRILPLFAVVFFCASQAVAQTDFPKPLNKLTLKDGDSIVFLGDSITHQRLYTQYVENYFYTRYPKLRLKTHNAGVGGAKAWDALQRFEKDVAAYKPKYVTVLLGMNDGQYRPFDKAIFETYQKDMQEVISRIKKAGAKPILMTPTMFDSRAARLRKRRRNTPEATLNQYNAVLAYYGAWLREVAMNEGHGYVDMYHSLNGLTLAARKKDPKFTVIADAVHPGPNGQAVMAYSFIRDMLPRSGVSSILLARAGKRVIARGVGGKLSNLKALPGGGLEFTFRADHLPWVIPEDAQKALRMMRVPRVVNAEILRALSLPNGKWEFTIDGEKVGTFTNQQFFSGLKLHNSKQTPQYKRALEIAKLNAKRNEGPIKKLRDEWRNFQTLARLQRQVRKTPGNQKLQEQIDSLKRKLNGLDERIENYQKEAKAIEDKIFEINKPKEQKYVIKKTVLTSVEGTVTLDGKPLPGAIVRFLDAGGNVVSAGKTDENGQFEMKRDTPNGVPVGEYRVTISTTLKAPGEFAKRSLLPPKYSSSDKTALRVSVVDSDNVIDFKLNSK